MEVFVSFNILEPHSKDAMPFNDYIESWKNESVDPFFCIHFGGDYKKYSSSIYKACRLYAGIFPFYREEMLTAFSLNNKYYDIEDMIRSIKEKTYKGEDKYWDSDEGLKRFKIEEGVAACKLIKKRCQLILRYHPDFIFAYLLKIQIALCNIEIGK